MNPNDTQCKICQPGSFCPGGSRIELNPGYWRNDIQSDVIDSCNDSGKRCLGGYLSNCSAGFNGVFCLQCDDQKQYLPGNRLGSCQVCDSSSSSAIITGVLMLLYTIPYQFFVITVIMGNNTNYITAIIRKTTKYLPDTSPYVNLLTTYSQIITIVLSVSVTFQNDISYLPMFGNPIEIAFLSLECILFQQFGVSVENLIYYRIILFSLAPFIIWLLFVGLYSLVCRFNLDFVRRMKIVCGLATLVLMQQPAIINELFRYLNCEDLGEEGSFMSTRPNYSCETEDYLEFKNWVYGLIGFWIIFVPFILWIFLFLNRKNLDKEKIRYILGGFFNEYKNEFYYWGVFLIYFKVGLLLISNSGGDTKVQALSSFALLFCFKSLTDFAEPFKSDYLYKAQKLALLAYAGSVLLAFYADDNPFPFLFVMAVSLLLILNGAAISYILFVLFLMYRIKHGEKVLVIFASLKRCDWRAIKESVLEIKDKPTITEVQNQLKKTTLQAPESSKRIESDSKADSSTKNTQNEISENLKRGRRSGVLAQTTKGLFDPMNRNFLKIGKNLSNFEQALLREAASQSINKDRELLQPEKKSVGRDIETNHEIEESKQSEEPTSGILIPEENILKEFELLQSKFNRDDNLKPENHL